MNSFRLSRRSFCLGSLSLAPLGAGCSGGGGSVSEIRPDSRDLPVQLQRIERPNIFTLPDGSKPVQETFSGGLLQNFPANIYAISLVDLSGEFFQLFRFQFDIYFSSCDLSGNQKSIAKLDYPIRNKVRFLISQGEEIYLQVDDSVVVIDKRGTFLRAVNLGLSGEFPIALTVTAQKEFFSSNGFHFASDGKLIKRFQVEGKTFGPFEWAILGPGNGLIYVLEGDSGGETSGQLVGFDETGAVRQRTVLQQDEYYSANFGRDGSEILKTRDVSWVDGIAAPDGSFWMQLTPVSTDFSWRYFSAQGRLLGRTVRYPDANGSVFIPLYWDAPSSPHIDSAGRFHTLNSYFVPVS
jgi:hypothetical protein